MKTTIKHLNLAMKMGTLQPHEGQGHEVRIGFVSLITEKYLGSSQWLLNDGKGGKYKFVPYDGLFKLN